MLEMYIITFLKNLPFPLLNLHELESNKLWYFPLSNFMYIFRYVYISLWFLKIKNGSMYIVIYLSILSVFLSKKKNTKHYHPEALDIPKTYQTEFFSTT